MATTTAPETGKAEAEAALLPRPLWQAPLFVLGAAALAAVWFGRPLFPTNPPRAERDLAQARSILGKTDGNVEYALKLARRALEASERLPDFKGEAAFLAGLACMALAEKGAADQAKEQWLASRQYLEQAKEAGVSEDDKSRLAFRLGKAGLRTGADLPGVIADLKLSASNTDHSASNAEHRVEAYALLAQACMRLDPPNLEEALKANTELRGLAETPDEIRTAAKLQDGEWLLRLGRPKEARLSLEKINDMNADPATVQRARLLLARAFMDEKSWGDAADAYTVALAGLSPAEAPLARFYLGMCYRNLDNADAAIKAWEECQRTAKGPEGLASSLALAEARLGEPADHAKAAEALTRAAAAAQDEAKWTNPFLTFAQFRDVFDRSLAGLRTAGRHDLVLGLADAYRRVVPLGQALATKAEAAAALAAKTKEGSSRSKQPDDELRKAREYAAMAGEAREQLAGLPGQKPEDVGELLYRAAMDHLAAEDGKRSAGVLFRLVKTEGVRPERLGEAYYRMAEHYRDSGQKPAAVEAFRKCMEYETRWSYLACYQLAMADLEAGKTDDAEAKLVFNLKMLRFDRDPEARAQSLFALGNLLYQRRDHRRVVRYLEDALGQFKDDPKHKGSQDLTRARFQLADSYRQVALRESQSLLSGEGMSKETREHFQKQHQIWLRQAADEFAALDAFLDTPAGKDHLARDQRMQVPFITAKCYFNLGQRENIEKSLKVYERLIERYPDKVEGLDALGGAVSCHAALGQIDKVRQRLLQIDKMLELPGIPDDAKKDWKKWLEAARKPLKDV